MIHVKRCALLLLVLPLILTVGCEEKSVYEMSPQEVIDLYFKLRAGDDRAALQQILYFPPEFTQKQIDEKTADLTAGREEKMIFRAIKAEYKVEYEIIIDDETAEVGVAIYSGKEDEKTRRPFQQIILRNDYGIWKYDYSTHRLTEDQLIERIKNNPYDASAIYLLGRKYQPQNSARANRYYKKYLELEPDGFWKDEHLINGINEVTNIKEKERDSLQRIENMPLDAVDRATGYVYLCNMYVEHGDYNKAQMYLDKAQTALETSSSPKSPSTKSRLEAARRALQQALQGKPGDILKELELNGTYSNH